MPEPAPLLEQRVVSEDEMRAWRLDRRRSGQQRWSEIAWGDSDQDPRPFNLNTWPCRIVFSVPRPARVVRAECWWRRSRLSIRLKGLKLIGQQSGGLVTDARLVHYDQERVVVDFRPASGPGVYYLYYGAREEPYFKPSPAWLALAEKAKRPLRVQAEAVEARCPLDRFDAMETIATCAELRALLARHPQAPYLVFAEDRDLPIKLRDDIPAHWAREGPRATLTLKADRNEYRVFQIGVWACRADIADLRASAADLRGAGDRSVIPADGILCLTLDSRTRHLYMGRPTPPFPVARGCVKALWFGIDIPEDAAPGEYQGSITICPDGMLPTTVELRLDVSEKCVTEKGDHDLWRLSRLRWLESNVGLDDRVRAPFKPLRVCRRQRNVSAWKHTYALGADGLPEQILVGRQELLAAPISVPARRGGRQAAWGARSFEFTETGPDHVCWRAVSARGGLKMRVEGRIEFDGCAIVDVAVLSRAAMRVEDLAFTLRWRKEVAQLASGLGYRGLCEGDRAVGWVEGRSTWNPSVWIGTHECGLGWLTESLQSWEEPARPDAVTIAHRADSVALTASFGAHEVGPQAPWRFRFALRPTPVKPPDPRHWDFRYFHKGGDFKPGPVDTPQSFLANGCRRLDELARLGVRRLNLHDWWGPAFNYPWQWEGPDNLSRLTSEAHRRGIFVKVYNSGRELSALAPEFWALVQEAQRGEGTSISDPDLTRASYQDAWHEHRHPPQFDQGWPRISMPHGTEHSVVVGNAHRYGNFYLEGVRYMTRFFGTDGAYWDGAEYPYPSRNRAAGFGYVDRHGRLMPVITYLAVREMARRMWAMLRDEKPEALIDAHHGTTNLTSPVADHMLCFPFVDSIWHGEGFEYERYDRWQWLVEISGIPFGVPSELLGGDQYLARAMLFGIWPRAGWGAGTENQRRLWAFFDEFGIRQATMRGWWETPPLARVDRADTCATVFVHPRNGLLAVIASWHPPIAPWVGQALDVSLALDYEALGMSQDGLSACDALTREPLDAHRPIPLQQPGCGRLVWIHPT